MAEANGHIGKMLSGELQCSIPPASGLQFCTSFQSRFIFLRSQHSQTMAVRQPAFCSNSRLR